MLHAVLSAATEGGETHSPVICRSGTTSSGRRSASSSSSSSSGSSCCRACRSCSTSAREAIEGNIAKADEAQRKAEAALEEYTAQLADARAEAGRIRETARADGKKILAEAEGAGHRPRPPASPRARRRRSRRSARPHSSRCAPRWARSPSTSPPVSSASRSPTTRRRPPSSTASSPTWRPPRGRRRREEVVHG